MEVKRAVVQQVAGDVLEIKFELNVAREEKSYRVSKIYRVVGRWLDIG
jgi:hypothetical protein